MSDRSSRQSRGPNAASSGAVKVPKEIQVRKLKEAFKNADLNGEGRVDLDGFVRAISELNLGASEITVNMLFMMSLPSAEAEQLTYMDFYKSLKKGCENYPGCSAQDVVGNLVLEYGNTAQGRKAKNKIKARQRAEAKKKEEEERQKRAEAKAAEAAERQVEEKEDIRDIANNDWASKDSLAVDPPTQENVSEALETQSETIPNSRKFYENNQRRHHERPATQGHPNDFHHDNREREESHFYNEGSTPLYHAPPASRPADFRHEHHHKPSYHQYSNSVNHLPPRQDRSHQAKARSSLDFRNAERLGLVTPQQMVESDMGHNNQHVQDIRSDFKSEDFGGVGTRMQDDYRGGSMGRASQHAYSDSRATLPDDFVNQFEDDTNDYSNYLNDVDDLLGGKPRQSGFLHRRNRSVDRPTVDLSHITNYLRSQDQILNARLISLEDNLRRQMNSQHTLLQGIPVYNKNQIKSWINTETQLLNHQIKNIMDSQVKTFKGLLEEDEDDRFKDESRKTYEKITNKMQVMQNLLDKINRNSDNNRLEIGEISNNLAEMHELGLNRNPSTSNRGDVGTSEAIHSLFENHSDNIEACVDQSFKDVHMKLGSKIERVENILLAVAMKSGIQIPDSPDWETEHKKLADQHVKVLQQQQAALDAQSKELKKIKLDMQREAVKLKQERSELQKIKAKNTAAQRDLAMKEENVGKALVKLKTERELMRSVKPSASIDAGTTFVGGDALELPGDIQASLQKIEADGKELRDARKRFEDEKEALVKTQEDKLFQVENKMRQLQELKADIKAEKAKLKAKKEQMKKDNKHVEDCKNDLETIFDEIASKRNEVLNREQTVQKREGELKKMEREVKHVMREKDALNKAREKMNELQKKFVEDLKAKDQEIEAWKKQASTNGGDTEGLDSLRTAFESEKNQLIAKHDVEKKKLAVAAREKFRKDFRKEIDGAKREIEKLRRSQDKEKAALKDMKADLMHSVQQFEQQKKQSKREIRHEREALSKEKKRFNQMIEAATPRTSKKFFPETGGEETSINSFLEDLGPILQDSGGKTTE